MKPYTRALLIVSLAIRAQMGASAVEQQQQKQEANVRKVVEDSQRAAHEKRDLKRYFAAHAKDAKFTSARGKSPGKYDQSVTLEQSRIRTRLENKAPKPKFKLDFQHSQTSVQANLAQVQHESVAKQSDGSVFIVGELYRLRKTSDGWKIYENRYWPIQFGDQKFNKATWKSLDETVTKTSQGQDPYAHISALFEAMRYAEAYSAAKTLTKEHSNDAHAWIYRGHAAILVCAGNDSLRSFRKALKIDPKAEVPPWVKAQPKPGFA